MKCCPEIPRPMLRSSREPVSWACVHTQFGAGFALVKHLKPRFTDALKIALAVYPEAWRSKNRASSCILPPRPFPKLKHGASE